ncbi:MAG: hypothetical protein ACE147_04850 [Candidatus Methylomirabilales bacterium]
MSSKGNLTFVGSPTSADRWIISVDLTRQAVEIRNDLRGSLFVATRGARQHTRTVGSYDRPALVRALLAAARLHSELGLDFAVAGRLAALDGAAVQSGAPLRARSARSPEPRPDPV